MIAFLTSVAEKVGPASRHIHYGLTSSDVVDTALALVLVEACDILLVDLDRMLAVLKRRAIEHKGTVMVGRTHGIHAEPYTLGLKFVGWYLEMQRSRARLVAAREEIRFGKLSGAVGTYAHLDPSIEAEVLARLGLQVRAPGHAGDPARPARGADGDLGHPGLVARSDRHRDPPLAAHRRPRSGRAVRRRARRAPPRCRTSGTRWVAKTSRGSRASCSAYVQASLENIPLWHERDISHSSVERVALPDATTLCDTMLHRMTGILDGLIVYPERMAENMERTKGLIFSQAVLLALASAGLPRETAYAIVQRNAMKVWEGTGSFREWLAKDAELSAVLSPEELAACFDAGRSLEHVDAIYARAFTAD